jgi:cytochrome P450
MMTLDQPLLPDIDFAHDEVANLHELLDQLRPHGPVVRVRYHGQGVWLITDYAELRQAFADEEHFQSAAAYRIHSEPSMGRTIQTMAGEEHRINRALVSHPFFPKQVRALGGTLLEPEAHRLMDELATTPQPLDLVQRLCRPYPFRVITRMLGIPVDDDDRFLEWALKLIDYPWDPDGALRARREFSAYLTPIIHQRRAEPGDDILSILAGVEFEGHHLTDEEILSFCRLLFPAGSDTTYKNLGSLLAAILAEPALIVRARGGDADRAALVQEGLRWQPPTALLPRMCSRDTNLGGVTIKQGEWVLFGITAANSDPAVFADPRRFDPARTGKNLAFGHGVHFCLGSHLARAELETCIKVLFARFPGIALAEGHPVEIVQGVLRGPKALWVNLGPAASGAGGGTR